MKKITRGLIKSDFKLMAAISMLKMKASRTLSLSMSLWRVSVSESIFDISWLVSPKTQMVNEADQVPE